MALQTTGLIDLSDIKAEFSGTNPVRLSAYYKGGSLVPNISNNAKVPTAGQIKLSDFYGAIQFVPKMYTLTLNVSMGIDGSDYFWFGWYNVAEPSAPYALVTHRNWQNAWSMKADWSLTTIPCTNLSQPLRSTSYTGTPVVASGTTTLLYSNVKLPYNIPKFDHIDFVAPDPVLGYEMQANKVMVQLENISGRCSKTFHQKQSAINNYTTIILVDDDGFGSWTAASFRLTYRWVQLTP